MPSVRRRTSSSRRSSRWPGRCSFGRSSVEEVGLEPLSPRFGGRGAGVRGISPAGARTSLPTQPVDPPHPHPLPPPRGGGGGGRSPRPSFRLGRGPRWVLPLCFVSPTLYLGGPV